MVSNPGDMSILYEKLGPALQASTDELLAKGKEGVTENPGKGEGSFRFKSYSCAR